MKKTIILILLMISILISACSSAPHSVSEQNVTKAWNGDKYEDLLILGLYDDDAYRASSETGFASILSNNGISSKPSYQFFPKLNVFMDSVAFKQQAERMESDAILAIRTLDAGYDYSYDDYLETRGWVYLLGGKPGAGTDIGSFISWAGSGLYTLNISLWDIKTEKLIWTVTTNSNATGSESEDTKALAEFITNLLLEKGLVKVKLEN